MKKVFPFVLVLISFTSMFSQNLSLVPKLSLKPEAESSALTKEYKTIKNPGITKSSEFGPGFPILIVAAILNPIVLYENKKVYAGTTRELTVGFGKYTKFRISIEYSFLFRDFLKHHFRASAKYDLQLSKSKGRYISDQLVLSFGTGYFLDEEGGGIFPEVTTGYKLGEKYLVFPYIKLRHTLMFTKTKPDITDFSVGVIWGLKAF